MNQINPTLISIVSINHLLSYNVIHEFSLAHTLAARCSTVIDLLLYRMVYGRLLLETVNANIQVEQAR